MKIKSREDLLKVAQALETYLAELEEQWRDEDGTINQNRSLYAQISIKNACANLKAAAGALDLKETKRDKDKEPLDNHQGGQ